MKNIYYSITRLLHAMCNTINTAYEYVITLFATGITVLHETSNRIKKALHCYDFQRILNFLSLSKKITYLKDAVIFKHTGFPCNTVIPIINNLIINALNQIRVLQGHVILN